MTISQATIANSLVWSDAENSSLALNSFGRQGAGGPYVLAGRGTGHASSPHL